MKINIKMAKEYFLAFCLITVIMAFSNTAGADQISATLCKVVTLLTGTAGKAIATIAIVVLGIGLFMGKLSWPLALATAIGVGLIFGAPQLVGWLSGGTTLDCATMTS